VKTGVRVDVTAAALFTLQLTSTIWISVPCRKSMQETPSLHVKKAFFFSIALLVLYPSLGGKARCNLYPYPD
jgi:hypothetical protein